MSACQVLNLVFGTALLVLGLTWRWSALAARKRSAAHRPTATAERMATAWDTRLAVRTLIEETPELQTLYDKLGYSAQLDRQTSEIVASLRALIRTEVPDFAALFNALNEARAQHEKLAAPQTEPQTKNDSLLRAVLAAGNDSDTVLRLLNRDPVDEQLPYVEQIPVNKNGELIWRTPLEHSLLRKRPADAKGFALLLDQLEQLFKQVKPPYNRASLHEVLEASERVRRDLQKETAYMPTSLQILEKKVADYRSKSPSPTALAKINQLDQLLTEFVQLARHDIAVMRQLPTASEDDLMAFKSAAQQLAKTYLEQTWMHTPWLSSRLLALLLAAETAPRAKEAQTVPTSPAAVLKVVCDEVMSGSYDRDETIRRLQQQEARGVFVNSLIYPLLRLHQPAVSRVGKAGLSAS